MTEIKAQLKYLKIGPRKVRLVANLIRGKKALRAVELLSLTHKKSARALKGLVESALANAKNNFEIQADDLRVSKVTVDGGSVLKRWLPRARGRATPIRKRMSHVTLVLSVIENKTNKAKTTKTKEQAEPEKKVEKS